MTSTLPPNPESGYLVRRHQVEADHAAAFIEDLKTPSTVRDRSSRRASCTSRAAGRRLTEPSWVTFSSARALVQAALRPHTMIGSSRGACSPYNSIQRVGEAIWAHTTAGSATTVVSIAPRLTASGA